MKFVSLWLVFACIIMFVLQILFGTDIFILDRSLLLSEPWRIVTSIFAHGGIAHLLSNLFALGLFGLILEGSVGSKRALFLFFSTGILVNIFSPYQQSLGASGAIFGILGALIVLRPLMVVWIDFIPMPMVVAGLFWLGSDILGIFVPDGVGHLAHISGLVLGLLFGFYWRKEFGDEISWRGKGRRKDRFLERGLDSFERREGLR